MIQKAFFIKILINYFIFLRKTNAARIIYKHKIIELLKNLRDNNKFIPSNTTDKQLNSLYNSIYTIFTNIITELENTQTQYKLQLRLLWANLYFARMKLYCNKLKKIARILINDEDSIIKKIHKKIVQIIENIN